MFYRKNSQLKFNALNKGIMACTGFSWVVACNDANKQIGRLMSWSFLHHCVSNKELISLKSVHSFCLPIWWSQVFLMLMFELFFTVNVPSWYSVSEQLFNKWFSLQASIMSKHLAKSERPRYSPLSFISFRK